MSITERDLFETLEPPPGGRAMLRRRLERERARRLHRRLIVAGASMLATAAAIVLTVWLGSAPAPESPSGSLAAAGASHPLFVSVGLEPAPTEPVVVRAPLDHQYAVQRVELGRDDVVFYMVSSRPEAESQSNEEVKARSGPKPQP